MPDISGITPSFHEYLTLQIPQNEFSKKLSYIAQKVNKANPYKKKLTSENQDPVDSNKKHIRLFPMPLSIFQDYPINATFVETSEHTYIATESETSEQF